MPKTERLAPADPAESLPAPMDSRALLAVAARVLREHGLAATKLSQVAAALGMTPQSLSERYATKDILAQGIFAETIRILKAADSRAWPGYGSGMRRTLAAARSFEDGYVVLVREAMLDSGHHASWLALRRRSGQRLRALLWHPNDPPPIADQPPLTDLVVGPMAAFCIEAITHWVEVGDREQDDLFLGWCGKAIQGWRQNACEILDLDTPDQDWPFDTEAPVLRGGLILF